MWAQALWPIVVLSCALSTDMLLCAHDVVKEHVIAHVTHSILLQRFRAYNMMILLRMKKTRMMELMHQVNDSLMKCHQEYIIKERESILLHIPVCKRVADN